MFEAVGRGGGGGWAVVDVWGGGGGGGWWCILELNCDHKNRGY